MSADDRCELLCLDLEKAETIRRSLRAADFDERAGRSRALGDPTRLLIAAALAEADELCVCDLAWIAERPQNLVSHHLRALRHAGLVESRRDGKMMLYRLGEQARPLLRVVLAEGEHVA